LKEQEKLEQQFALKIWQEDRKKNASAAHVQKAAA
jgi:hypothetical protein